MARLATVLANQSPLELYQAKCSDSPRVPDTWIFSVILLLEVGTNKISTK
jgi:hypothetical protein